MMRNQRNKRRHPRFILNLFVSSFGFYSLGHNPKFYLSLFFIPLVSHHWNTILYFILIYSLFILFRIIGTPFQGLFKFLLFFPQFLIIGTPSQVLSKLIRFFLWFLIFEILSQVQPKFCHCSFGFSSLGHHPSFFLCLFFVHFISSHLDTILGSI